MERCKSRTRITAQYFIHNSVKLLCWSCGFLLADLNSIFNINTNYTSFFAAARRAYTPPHQQLPFLAAANNGRGVLVDPTTSSVGAAAGSLTDNMAAVSQEDKDNALMQLLGMTDDKVDPDVASQILESTNYDVQRAVDMLFGGGAGGPSPAMPPAAPAFGGAENMRAPAAFGPISPDDDPMRPAGQFDQLIGPGAAGMMDQNMTNPEDDAELQRVLAESAQASFLNNIVNQADGVAPTGLPSAPPAAASRSSAPKNDMFAASANPNHLPAGATTGPYGGRSGATPSTNASGGAYGGTGGGSSASSVQTGGSGDFFPPGADAGAGTNAGATSSSGGAAFLDDRRRQQEEADAAMARALAESMQGGQVNLSEEEQMRRAMAASDPALMASRDLRAQQDAELQESMLMDRMREQREKAEREEAEALRKSAEEEEARKVAAEQQKQTSVKDRVAALEAIGQIANDDPEKLKLVFRLPSGKRVEYVFSKSKHKVHHLYDFVDGKLLEAGDEATIGSYTLASSFPKFMIEKSDDALGTTKLENQSALMLQKN
ncbi:unnamed protein product [Amoebophrya sp. A120]|nr:unnamed protein product [Amoebophrya sp. A120]|eukprot:GSA120T00024588001.1